MLKPYEVLERAADLIDREGHRKGKHPVTFGGPHCALNAIGVVQALDGDSIVALMAAVGMWIGDWNDAPERTKDEVTSTMRAVAATLRAKDGASLGVRQHVAESTVVTTGHADAAVMPELLFR